jgi:hypothetical protein
VVVVVSNVCIGPEFGTNDRSLGLDG